MKIKQGGTNQSNFSSGNRAGEVWEGSSGPQETTFEALLDLLATVLAVLIMAGYLWVLSAN